MSDSFKRVLKLIRDKMSAPIISTLEGPLLGSIQIQQRILEQNYREMVRRGIVPSLTEVEYRVFSQNGEDGIIAFLLSAVGTESRLFFEIGVESGTECNSANLAKNSSWDGWLVEGDSTLAERARLHYETHPCTWTRNIRVISSFVTQENINDLIRDNHIPDNIDFLSVDIDGMDWWIWKAIRGLRPRVVALEYNASFGPELCVTVPYATDFARGKDTGLYHGASLRAFVKLGEEKGYRFVGCNSTGLNAFFVRSDLAANTVAAVSVERGYRPNTYRARFATLEEQMRKLRECEVVAV